MEIAVMPLHYQQRRPLSEWDCLYRTHLLADASGAMALGILLLLMGIFAHIALLEGALVALPYLPIPIVMVIDGTLSASKGRSAWRVARDLSIGL